MILFWLQQQFIENSCVFVLHLLFLFTIGDCFKCVKFFANLTARSSMSHDRFQSAPFGFFIEPNKQIKRAIRRQYGNIPKNMPLIRIHCHGIALFMYSIRTASDRPQRHIVRFRTAATTQTDDRKKNDNITMNTVKSA